MSVNMEFCSTCGT